MVVDGFKSYGQRTEINGFDHEFNAITGLNGSGKSNILDAICFLLGITNLSHVRATNLQELVYKNGQAGVTKASVSITFDNRNKKQSPLGYDQYDEIVITRQVIIGGKNKYMINGANIQANRVADFFRSVQLNVNNPHFLIMQGRITKVLNMKPPEILAMIEEAVGTGLYEQKKQQAQKTIEKKDAKLREINDILNEEITPTLKKLKEERATYLEYQKIQRELDHLTKLWLAFQFLSAQEAAEKLDHDKKMVEENLAKLQNDIVEGEKQIESITTRIEELQRQRDQEQGGKLEQLEKELKEKEKDTIKVESNLKNVKDSKKQEEKKKQQIIKGKNTDEKALDEKTKIASDLKSVYDKLRENDENCANALKTAQARFEAISVGKFSSDEGGKSATLQQQLMDLKANLTKAQTTVKTSDMKLKHNAEALKKAKAEMKKTDSEYGRDSSNLKKYETEVENITKQLSNMNYEDGSFEEMEENYRNVKHETNSIKTQVDTMGARYPWLDFRYSDPEPGFDRSQVYGVAAKLFKIKDMKFAVALDTAGGGKVTNVIVENSDAAGKILQHGRLAKRTVMLPLDKMHTNPIPHKILQIAQKSVGSKNVFRAIDLIEFDNRFEPAMNHIFGNVLVCSDLDVANKVAFDPQIKKLCVTLDGDKVNPSGELSGGAPSSSGSMLTQIMSVLDASKNLEIKQDQLNVLKQQLQNLERVGQKYNNLKQQYEMKSHELELIRERLKTTRHHQLAQEVEEMQVQNAELENGLKEAKLLQSQGDNKMKELEYKIKNAKALKEKELKAAEVEVKQCKKDVDAAKKQWGAKEAEEAALTMEIDELKKAIDEANEQLGNVEQSVQNFDQEIQKLGETITEAKNEATKAKDAVKQQKEAVASTNKEIGQAQGKMEKITKSNKDGELEIQKLEHKMNKASDEAKEAKKTVEAMLAKYDWIAVDMRFFGQPNTAYDFSANDPKEAQKKIQKLEATKEKLQKTVNMRAMNMLGKAEEQYTSLINKKTTVENDKSKIRKVIEELDVKKKAELRAAWEKVNKDFGSIFAMLLPGTKAKLQPPEGKDVLDGLEVKVAFGANWKESLSELSGGQRSLVALSLILSLLLFKPAPLYILDEVDAALDLSHTQNIGQMLKSHFKSSQFIVVSLKDGMFNNANVLFRTKFVDGMSTVGRTTQVQHKK